jgi:hypothetical protein
MTERMTKAQLRGHNIEVAMQKCRHFTGTQTKVCKAGVNYDDVMPIPCIGRIRTEVEPAVCEKKSCWTREEAIENEAKREEQTARFMLGLHAAHEAAKALGLKKGHGGVGTVECPVCHGTLRFTVASYNGHLWGRCDTQGCLSWMQ